MLIPDIGKQPEKPARKGKAQRFGAYSFTSRADLEDAVKNALRSHPRDVEFIDAFLLAVVNELHPEVRAAGQHCLRMRLLSHAEQVRRGMDTAVRFRGGDLLEGWFEPLIAWRDVTVYPWRTASPRVELKNALREKCESIIPSPTALDRCAAPGCPAVGFALEYHHVDPVFTVIAERCLDLFTPAEIESRLGYSKFAPGCVTLADFMPDSHPAVLAAIDAHRGNRWEWRCHAHHVEAGKAKRQ